MIHVGYFLKASDYMYTYILSYEKCVKNRGAGVKILWREEACSRWVSTIQTMVHILHIQILLLVHILHIQILLLHIYTGAYYTGTNTTATVRNT